MVFCWMKNEEDMVPFFLRHYAFADKLVVWDNESTDGTRAALEKDSRVEVREWATGGEMRDLELARMKSEEYRRTGPGWKIIVDADEFLWHPQIRRLFEWYDSVGVTVPATTGYDMVSVDMPNDDGKSLLTDLVKTGVPNPLWNKPCVVRGDQVNVTYWPGAHKVDKVSGRVMSATGDELKLLHYRYMGMERTARKAQEYRQSQENVVGRMGEDNCNVGVQVGRWRHRWLNRQKVI